MIGTFSLDKYLVTATIGGQRIQAIKQGNITTPIKKYEAGSGIDFLQIDRFLMTNGQVEAEPFYLNSKIPGGSRACTP